MKIYLILFFFSIIYPFQLGIAKEGNNKHIYIDTLTHSQYGVITKKEFALKPPKYEPNADYMYIHRNVDISFERNNNHVWMLINHHHRIKIFDPLPENIVQFQIELEWDDDNEILRNIDVTTFSVDGKQWKLPQDAYQYIELPSYGVRIVEYTPLNAEPESIIDIQYQLKYDAIDESPIFYFDAERPVLNASVRIHNVDYIRYKPHFLNYDQNIAYYEYQKKIDHYFYEPQHPTTIIQTWILKNIMSFQYDEMIDDPSIYRRGINFILSEIGLPRQHLDLNWAVIAAHIKHKLKLNQTERNYKTILDNILSNIPIHETKNIYRYISKNTKFNNIYTSYFEDNLDQVAKGMYSNQSSINLLLLLTLRAANIEAFPALITSRSTKEINNMIPSLRYFKGFMVATKENDKWILWDASLKNAPKNFVPPSFLLGSAFILTDNSFKWHDTFNKEAKYDVDMKIKATLSLDNSLKGSMNIETQGYSAQYIRTNLENTHSPKEVIQNLIFKNQTDIDIYNIHIDNQNDINQSIVITLEFYIKKSYNDKINNDLALNPLFIGHILENPLYKDQRNLPVIFNAPEYINLQYSITIPDSIEVSSITDNYTIKREGLLFYEAYKLKQNQIDYNYKINIERKTYKKEAYQDIKKIFERWSALSDLTWYFKSKKL